MLPDCGKHLKTRSLHKPLSKGEKRDLVSTNTLRCKSELEGCKCFICVSWNANLILCVAVGKREFSSKLNILLALFELRIFFYVDNEELLPIFDV